MRCLGVFFFGRGCFLISVVARALRRTEGQFIVVCMEMLMKSVQKPSICCSLKLCKDLQIFLTPHRLLQPSTAPGKLRVPLPRLLSYVRYPSKWGCYLRLRYGCGAFAIKSILQKEYLPN